MAAINGHKEFHVAEARNDFPALSGAISNYLSGSNVQLGASYKVAQASTGKYEEGYEAAARFINASKEEIVIGPSTTLLFANLAQTLHFPPASEIVISKLDHEANISSWVRLARLQNLTIKWWAPPKTSTNPRLTPENLRPLLSDKTKFVSCTHASNILGTIHDIRAIADEVHTIPDAMLCVDGVALAPHREVDVKALGVDFYAFSWYKVYGPHVATLYASSKILPMLTSLGHYFHHGTDLRTKLGLAASSYELVASIPEVVRYLGAEKEAREASFQRMSEHEERLQGCLLEYLNGREDITVYGETKADRALRVPVISFSVNWRGSRSIVEKIEGRSDYACRWGHFYSKRLVDDVLKIDGKQGEEGEGVGKEEGEGVVRVSMVFYNTEDEIQGYVKILDEVLSEKP